MPSLVGKEVGPTGYGTMRMTWQANPPAQEVCFGSLNKTLELGANFWNGGELYGTPDYNSMHLLNKYFTKFPENAEKVVLSVKGGLKPGQLVPDGSEENIRRSVDECLRLLDGKKKIDIFECARQDPKFPVEHTVEVLAQYVKEGKIGGIGLSEVDAETIRKAHKVHPIAAVEVEMSLWSTDILENDIAKTCAELNIPVVAYSPLGRGVLAGAVTSLQDIPEGDFRRRMSRFQEENFQQNLKLINEVNSLASRKGMAPSQIALAWILSLSGKPGMPTIIPIPGGTTTDKVVQNMVGVKLLTEDELAEVDAILKKHTVAGPRY
ncbi:pyridoxal reductase (AKR8) [Penicillium macrosclerotiorum]|uniref:pyridoxal reductase (AKR8) n=1 Tax=Penicillium macrosclerotiorum TaxID=303699 RepID=UPI0025474083|nr:pyridoxal reductase (AKR8) [Penicillium macrosclerotiorum]KAJ5698533.1 pyridoxal reductase (AKR8) [Penicillium macrosclerotiorum]